ncbi:MAG: hypothetical protein SNG38_02715 [Rikenellaceae bacterium]
MSQIQNAAFSIINFVFDNVSLDLSKKGTDELALNFEPKGEYIQDKSLFRLIFSVRIKSEELQEPFAFIRCVGEFNFANVTSFSEIPSYFYANSIAILFPYVRSYISIITTQANMKGIILPTLNLQSLESTLRENTEVIE